MFEKILDKVSKVRPHCSSYKPVSFKDEKVGYIVKLLREDSNDYYEVDLWVDSAYRDVRVDWHQFEFNIENPEDTNRMVIQDNDDEFDCATSEAICYLENLGLIRQNDNFEWFDVR